jgi:hypothetical protein
MSIVADAADGTDGVMQLVLAYGRYRMVRVPNRPSRPKTITIPTARRKVCARPSRPANARGLFGKPDRLAPTCRRSDALPIHCARSAMISCTQAATADVLGRVAPVVGISGFKGCRGLEMRSPRRWPRARSRPCAAAASGVPAAACVTLRGRIQKPAKDTRSGQLELVPKRMLRPALLFGDWCER